jgi:two-component system, NtrC family, response regulator AtoC
MSDSKEGKVGQTILMAGAAHPSVELLNGLKSRGYRVLLATSAAAASETFEAYRPALVVIQLPLGDGTAGALARQLRRVDPAVMLVFVGSDADVKNGPDALELGACEHLERVTADGLLAVLDSAASERADDLGPQDPRDLSVGWGSLVGDSLAMQSVISVLRQICRRTWSGGAPTMLLSGETGTGKGFFAKCIHHNSVRRNEPFIEINCAALPPNLMEAELFGYERGAFTDAKTARPGLFEAAHGGTLFLDEIGALPLDLQAKLLKAIEEKQVRRLGGRQSTLVDVQIIAATHENVEARAKAGLFRYDLFHRLNVVAVTIPPLRERQTDAVLLAESFVSSICREYGIAPRRVTDGARDWIRRYSWPGNVRELRNRIERTILLENDDELKAEHFGAIPLPESGTVRVSIPPTGLRVALPTDGVPLEELERAVIREALVQCEGNVSRAARFLSISRQTLIYRMKKHGLVLRPDSGSYPRLVSIPPRPASGVSGRRAAGR